MAERADHDSPSGEHPSSEQGSQPQHGSSREGGSREGAPQAPIIVAPREEELVNGEDVTLQWEPVEGADLYCVEVAEDAPFHEVVVQEELEDTSLSLSDLPTDGDLYYWRVLARRNGKWSHGDRIESFVSVRADQVHPGEEDSPDRRESYGPATALFSSAGNEAAAEATGDARRFAREREMGVAHEGVEAGQIMGFAAAVLMAVIVIVCVLLFWVTSVAESARDAATEAIVYPELEETEARAAQQLEQYELVSERDSTYRIPIEVAMRIVANEEYEQKPGRRYSNELQIDVPNPLPDTLTEDAFVPEPSVPEGPPSTPETSE